MFESVKLHFLLSFKNDSVNNLGQNIRRFFHILAQFRSTTSETELDYHHRKVGVVSRVAERTKT